MINLRLNTILNDSSPEELREFVSSCVNNEDLVARLEKDPARLFSFLQSMKSEENEQMGGRLSMFLYKLAPEQLENPEIKKVETALRNRGLLNRNVAPDFTIQQEEVVNRPFQAHKAILALESPYFRGIAGFKEFQQDQLLIKQMGISLLVYEIALDYLYSSDDKRKNLISAIDKSLLFDLAQLAEYWQIEELKGHCDGELCNSIGELSIEKSDSLNWQVQSQFTPKFALLLGFIAKQAGDGDLDFIIEQMQNSAGAAELAAKCTSKEIALFSTLKTEFGKACQIPPGTFGKAEWEKAFPITITEVPPLPSNIHAILELEDPYEPGKKLKETYKLFLRPHWVILHEASGDRRIYLSFNGVEELAIKATHPERRRPYSCLHDLRVQMNLIPVAESGWVLMRKEVIPDSLDKSIESLEGLKRLLKEGFQMPKLMDVILMQVLTYASEEKLYGDDWKYILCQDIHNDSQTIVGGGDKWLSIFNVFDYDSHMAGEIGVSGVWKF